MSEMGNMKLVYTKHNVTVLEKIIPTLFKRVLNRNGEQINAVCNIERENLLQLGVRNDRIRCEYRQKRKIEH